MSELVDPNGNPIPRRKIGYDPEELRAERDFAALECMFLDQLSRHKLGGPRWKRAAQQAADRAYALDEKLQEEK